MDSPTRLIFSASVMIASFSVAADPPNPSPTPRPGTLAALARETKLRLPSKSGGEPIVITADTLAELSGGAVVTELETTVAEPAPIRTPARADSATRGKWRKKVLAQRARITKLEARRADVEAEIDRLERGSLDAQTLDRIEKAEARRAVIDAEIRRERTALSRIVTEARKQGAQPGWFR